MQTHDLVSARRRLVRCDLRDVFGLQVPDQLRARSFVFNQDPVGPMAPSQFADIALEVWQ